MLCLCGNNRENHIGKGLIYLFTYVVLFIFCADNETGRHDCMCIRRMLRQRVGSLLDLKGGDRMGHKDDVLMDSQVSWELLREKKNEDEENENIKWKYCK